MKATILTGDVFDVLPTIQRGSIDACVCSPPYWALRSYLAKGHPLKHLELGNEPTPDCGIRPGSMMELRKDLTAEDFEYVIGELRKIGLL